MAIYLLSVEISARLLISLQRGSIASPSLALDITARRQISEDMNRRSHSKCVLLCRLRGLNLVA